MASTDIALDLQIVTIYESQSMLLYDSGILDAFPLMSGTASQNLSSFSSSLAQPARRHLPAQLTVFCVLAAHLSPDRVRVSPQCDLSHVGASLALSLVKF